MKQIVKYFNSLVEKTLFKLKNKTNYFLLSFIFSILFYLSYLLIPSFYNKTWVKNILENKLKEDFKIDFILSNDISYNIFPSPHFHIKKSKIFITNNEKKKELSEIKRLKIYIGQKNYFQKEKISVNEILISNANFSIQGTDIKFLNKISHKKFVDKNIRVNNSNIFFKDNQNETMAITKIKFVSLFYDDPKKLNIFDLKGEVFNIPFDFSLNKNFTLNNLKEINFKSKKLKLNINDKSEKILNNRTKGINTLSFLNTVAVTKYSVDKKVISFEFDKSKIKNPNREYRGILSFEPFEFKMNLNFKKFDLFKLLDFDSPLGELFRSKLLFNENLNTNISINIGSNVNDEIFTSSEVKFNIINGAINFDKTKLTNKKIGLLEISNSKLYSENNNLILNGDIMIDIKNSDKLFSFFQTSKKFRKPIKDILINFDYDLISRKLTINRIKIDGNENNNEIIDIINETSDIEKYNLNKTKRVINKLFSVYAG